MVMILPRFEANRPRYTGCVRNRPRRPCPSQGSSAVWLHSAPDETAPLVRDPGRHPDGAPSTTSVYDHAARASTGQTYAVAGRSGDWTAIWYLGRRAWFHDPAWAPASAPAEGVLATPAPAPAPSRSTAARTRNPPRTRPASAPSR
ncbi:hypothetical protein [Thermocatellispora tengchongensis]|uniref:hypothetical protein n=1 Tax=Thermocatellispora tengchongensis TaxID=1073253 RepID=UPI003626460F